ncbi:sodium/potassium-transporting ATPase subunit beta-1 isoform X2 [Aethina tumida]|uniref:sodium/potassium-transporting ATPase subunit beta-1 isoform X2 n=1 Tax=Aethina tumida TaxID=116153 RepID=UPI0021476205|nr:sodium/potassium-transporting ATPase subunit beta-1 isoform X2 [Aethina tumida]
MAARLSEQSYRNEDQVTFKQKVKTFLYNPKEGTVCQRNCSDWIKLLLYIIVFTAIILIMTYLILHHYYSNLMDETHPHEDKFTTSDKIDPGLSFFPNINEISPIIYYSDKTRKASDYIDSITEIFDEYDQNFKHRSRSVRFVNCERPNFKGLRTQEYCLFNRDSLMNCSTSDFGYNAYQPCFYLKINKLPTWTPVYYDKKLPTNMPKSLQKHINEHSQEKIIWVDCAGRRTSDMEYLEPQSSMFPLWWQ